MCRTLGVNRTSFHDWERRAPSDRALSDASLIERVKQVHAAGQADRRPPALARHDALQVFPRLASHK
jgi:hypothetical protein